MSFAGSIGAARIRGQPFNWGLVMKKYSSFVVLAFVLSLVASAFAASDTVTASKFKFQGFSYFRGISEDLRLASYGPKKTPFNMPNYMAHEGDVDANNLSKVHVDISGPYGFDWASQSATDVGVAIQYVTSVGGTAGFSRDVAKKANLKLMKFSISAGELKKLVNKHAGAARNYLKDAGGEGRVVSAAWVAIDATLGAHVKNCGSLTGAGAGGGFSVKLDTKACKTTISKVDFPDNVTFAYGLHKVKKWNKDKTEIEDWEDDFVGDN